MKEFVLPELGENIEEASVIGIMVSEGDTVKKDQSVLEIETDKATVEVPSEVEGTIKKLYVKEGDKVKTGQVVFEVDDAGDEGQDKESGEEEKSDEQSDKKSPPEEKKEKPQDKEKEEKPEEKERKEEPEEKAAEGGLVEFTLPELGENIESAKVVGLLVKEGDTIKKDQPILEIETDKATIEVPSDVSGKIVDFFLKEGDTAKVGQTVMKVETTEKPSGKGKEKADKKTAAEKPEADAKKTGQKKEEETEPEDEKQRKAAAAGQPPILEHPAPAAPSVRRIARELGVDINSVQGSGPGGRISMDDVKAHVKKMNEERSETGAAASGVKAEALPDFSKFGEIERESMSTIREKTADHLSYAWAVIPHVTQHDKADITELERIRKDFSKKVADKGGKLTLTSILVKIVASAMKVFPQFNASVDMEKKEIIYKKYVNIGVAVDTDRGLIVPVIKDANLKNITDISIELSELSKKARDRKIGLDDLQGGCFSISNLGGIGGTYFTPVVNSPEVAILGVSRGTMEPVYINNEFQPRLLVPLSLSYDHRIIDGADAMRFLNWIREALEQPFTILVDG